MKKFKKYFSLSCIFLLPSLLYTQNCDYLQEADGNCHIFSAPYGGDNLWNMQSFPPTDLHNCSQGSEWKLIFEDEFNDTALDNTKWETSYPWGNFNVCDGSIHVSTPNNVEVSNGTLKLYARQETITTHAFCCPPCCFPNCNPIQFDTCPLFDGLPNLRTFNYTGGMIHTQHNLSLNPDFGNGFSAGKFEIRCKIPKIDGVWPAFWLFGECGQELDVFEFGNQSFGEDVITASKRPRLTYHKKKDCNDFSSPVCGDGYDYFGCPDYSESPHIFSVEWDHYKIIWRIDGQLVRVISGLATRGPNNNCEPLGSFIDECSAATGVYCTNPIMPTENMHIIAGLGVRDFSLTSVDICKPPFPRTQNWTPLTRGIFPAVFEIDYIRVYQRVLSEEVKYDCTPFRPENVVINDNHIHGSHTLHILETITTDPSVTVHDDADIWWTAGDYIELNDGFTVEEGAKFTAEIARCSYTTTKTTSDFIANPQSLTVQTINKHNSNKGQDTVKSANTHLFSPNPSNGKFNLQLNTNAQSEIFIYNPLGQLVFQSTITNPQSEINLSSHPRGIYFLKVISGDPENSGQVKIYTEKIILQ